MMSDPRGSVVVPSHQYHHVALMEPNSSDSKKELETNPSAPPAESFHLHDENNDSSHSMNEFTSVVGHIPFKKPNVRLDHYEQDLERYINAVGLVESTAGKV